MTARLRTAAIALLAVSIWLIGAPAFAAFGDDVRGLINSSRSAQGLPALAQDAQIDAVAQDWAQRLATEGELSHNPDFGSQIPGGASSAAENVAMHSAPTAAAMHQSLMDSEGHRANILGDFTHVGIGYAVDDSGTGWLVEVFANYSDREPAPSDTAAEDSPDDSGDDDGGPQSGGDGGQSDNEGTQSRGTTENGPDYGTFAVQDLETLRPGDTGELVQYLQRQLTDVGYSAQDDGEFGSFTEAQLRAFQEDASIPSDGVAGQETWAALGDIATDGWELYRDRVEAEQAAQERSEASEGPSEDATEEPTAEPTEEPTDGPPKDDTEPSSELWISDLQTDQIPASAHTGMGPSTQVGILSIALVCGLGALIGLGTLRRRLGKRS